MIPMKESCLDTISLVQDSTNNDISRIVEGLMEEHTMNVGY